MPVTVILGGHWGDEGKGKLVDLLADRFTYNVRYSGGANAGHTVVNELGTFALHQVPSGVFRPGMKTRLAAGVVVDPQALLAEMDHLSSCGIPLDRFRISRRAHLVLPYHRALDTAAESRRSDLLRIGTTGKGIGPAYADKAARDGVRAEALLRVDFAELVAERAERANRVLTGVFGAEAVDVRALSDQARVWRERLAPLVSDVERELRSAARHGERLLLEGAQGALLDIDMGSYPYVTSSSTGAAGACASTGLPPSDIQSVLCVLHAYMTRVGEGPFPTELQDPTGHRLRERGNEFGTTTGRPRRCGWFDAVASRHSVEVNGATSLAVTKLDVLDGLPSVKIAVAYRVGEALTDCFPASADELASAEPLYEEMQGWSQATSSAREWSDLPRQAREYIARISELMGVPTSVVSVGPAREQTLVLRDPLEG